jgi:hypothetical protein
VSWEDVALEGDPLLVVALRDRKRRLEGRLVNVDASVHDPLREVASQALERVRAMDAVPYTPYVEPEEGEYLSVHTGSLKLRRTRREQAEAEEAEDADDTATLARIVEGADYLESVGPTAIVELPEESFYAQIICFRSGDTRVGFVTRTNPRQVLKRSIIPLGRTDDGDRLKRISKPELILEQDVHAIVTESEIAILNRRMFQYLVADTTLVASHVPEQVAVVEQAFAGRGFRLAPETREALESVATQSPRVANRLAAFAARIAGIDEDALRTGAGFVAQDLSPDDFIANGEITCTPDRIPELLDALEGRYFADSFSPEKRRADRFRRR